MRLVLAIPAYNEAKTIYDVVRSLPRRLPFIGEIVPLVVDDGSSDRTHHHARRAGALVLRHPINMGVGAATATAFAAAKELSADYLVTMDADGQHDPADIARLLKPLHTKRADVVIGTRLRLPEGMPWHRRVGNKLFNAITLLFFQMKTTDSQSGFRAYNQAALTCIRIHTLGYEVCTELFGEVKRNRLRMVEIPIKTIYTLQSRRKGQPASNGINIVFKLFSRMLIGSS